MASYQYNIKNKDVGSKNSFQLLHENIIVHYDVVEDLLDFGDKTSQENSKGKEVFCQPCLPYSKKSVHTKSLSSTTKPSRFTVNDFEKEQDAFSRETDSVATRIACQI